MTQSLQRFKAEFFKALAHPTRIRILELLKAGEKSVSELQAELAAEGSTASEQLAIFLLGHPHECSFVRQLQFLDLEGPILVPLPEALQMRSDHWCLGAFDLPAHRG